jgi:hypothetical protein
VTRYIDARDDARGRARLAMTMDELAAKAGRLLRGENAYTRATS